MSAKGTREGPAKNPGQGSPLGYPRTRGKKLVRAPHERQVTPNLAPRLLPPTQVLRPLPLQVLTLLCGRPRRLRLVQGSAFLQSGRRLNRQGLEKRHSIAQRDSPRGGGN